MTPIVIELALMSAPIVYYLGRVWWWHITNTGPYHDPWKGR